MSPFSPFFRRSGTIDSGMKQHDEAETVSSEGSSFCQSVDIPGRPVRVFSSTLRVDDQPGRSRSASSRKLGTINGVFLPCVQSIMGVILFLRLTNITGQAGCIFTSLIILTCTASTLLTSLSLSAIATNGTIQAGGPYYVISRTLGIEIGATIGLLFYVGTTLASTMYVLGAVEALQRTVALKFDARWASLVLMWIVASVVSVGVRYVNMASNFFFFMVLLSVVSMCVGVVLFGAGVWDGLLTSSDRVFMENIWPQYQADPETGITPTFWGLLAIFYPSVTGILAGSNRSAVLETPAKSIPRGTLGAIGFSTFIYLLVVWLFGSILSNSILIQDKFVVAAVAWPLEKLVAMGVIFSSIGAALQACAGAPLVLVAIAQDDVLPFLKCIKPTSPDEGPTRAIWFTWLLASLPALAGNLDYITPMVTMFFLLMYAGINLSCFLLGFLKSPGFRPTFRYFHWSTSLLGFVWCLALVALVSPVYLCVTIMAVIMMLYLYTKKQQARKDWGDVGNAIRYAVATASLSALSGSNMKDFHAKNWRPQLLTVVDMDGCGSPMNLHVLALAKQFKSGGGGGIHMVTSILRTTKGLERARTCDSMAYAKILLEHHIKESGIQNCFAQVVATASTRRQALWSAVVHSGLGPLSPNTVLLSYPAMRGPSEELHDYILTVQGIMNLKKAVIIFKGTSQYPPRVNEYAITPQAQTIDIWWIVHDGGLLLLLPYILSQDEVFEKNIKIRLFAVTSSATENPDRLRLAVIEHLARVRIRASVLIVDLSDTSIADDMRESDESVRLSTRDLTDTSTQNLTVGEVFSQEAYEVPYHAVWEDIMESGDASAYVPASPMADVEFPSGVINNAHSHGERMRTARSFNEALKQYSSRASLVVTNMPLIRAHEPAAEFFDYVDTMCASIDNMMLVRGSGIEVVTTYA